MQFQQFFTYSLVKGISEKVEVIFFPDLATELAIIRGW